MKQEPYGFLRVHFYQPKSLFGWFLWLVLKRPQFVHCTFEIDGVWLRVGLLGRPRWAPANGPPGDFVWERLTHLTHDPRVLSDYSEAYLQKPTSLLGSVAWWFRWLRRGEDTEYNRALVKPHTCVSVARQLLSLHGVMTDGQTPDSLYGSLARSDY